MSQPVRIVIPNPDWPNHYQKMKHQILKTIGSTPIEHIGSTSVLGLGSKPIIDIMVGVKGREEADHIQQQLENISYTDVTPQPGQAEWFYCLGTGTRELYYHVHLVITESDHWKKQLAFRAILRTEPEHARKYYQLKKELAIKHGSDRDAYTEAKTGFIEEILKRTNGSS